MVMVPFLYIAILLIVIWAIYRVIIFKKNSNSNIVREIFMNLFFIYFLMVINLTFCKMGAIVFSFRSQGHANLIPIVETIKMFNNNFMGVGNAYYNVIGNILLFVPLGLGIPLFFKNKNKLGKVALYGFMASLSIESLQYLTSINITDVDDIIFNTLGAIIGFLAFNICYIIIKKTKLVNLIDKITSSFDGNLILVAAKPIAIMVLVVGILSFTMVYNSTSSGKLSNEELASEVFKNSNVNEYIVIKNFSNYKLFLSKYKDYVQVQSITKVLNNRWVEPVNIGDFDNSKLDYKIILLGDNTETGVVVFGKSKDCTSVEITFKDKKYSEKLDKDSYFIVTYPTFEALDENTDIYNIYQGEHSNDLQVKFLEEDNTECTHMNVN